MIESVFGGLVKFFTPSHVLAVVALGLLAGQHARRGLAVTLAAFALGIWAGSVLIALALRETPAATTLLAIAAVAGLIVVLAIPLPPFIRHALAFTTGAALALNSPPQAITIAVAIAAQIGTGIAAIAALACVTVIATQAERPWQRIGMRIVGSWVAASAILVLALRFTR